MLPRPPLTTHTRRTSPWVSTTAETEPVTTLNSRRWSVPSGNDGPHGQAEHGIGTQSRHGCARAGVHPELGLQSADTAEPAVGVPGAARAEPGDRRVRKDQEGTSAI